MTFFEGHELLATHELSPPRSNVFSSAEPRVCTDKRLSEVWGSSQSTVQHCGYELYGEGGAPELKGLQAFCSRGTERA